MLQGDRVGSARSGTGSVKSEELDPTEFPVHAAAVSGDDGLLSHLLVGGADPNALCPNGRSALVYAVHGGSKACVDVLFSAGANANLADATGITAAHWAASQSDHKMLK